MLTETPAVVIKVGGSLLSLPDLSRRLQHVFQMLGVAQVVLVCGGGEAADIVRRWQPLHDLQDEQAHWLAFRAVSLNEQLLASVLPNTTVVRNCGELHAGWNSGQLPILAAEPFTRDAEKITANPLPHDWSVTSDSIAAWVARQIPVDSLILLKSCDLPERMGREAAAENGLVDRHFPVSAAGLSVSWMNLRTDSPRLVEWPNRVS